MPAVRIGPKHQVTIPKAVFANRQLEVGDFLEAAAQGGRIVLTPLQVGAKAPRRRRRGSRPPISASLPVPRLRSSAFSATFATPPA